MEMDFFIPLQARRLWAGRLFRYTERSVKMPAGMVRRRIENAVARAESWYLLSISHLRLAALNSKRVLRKYRGFRRNEEGDILPDVSDQGRISVRKIRKTDNRPLSRILQNN